MTEFSGRGIALHVMVFYTTFEHVSFGSIVFVDTPRICKKAFNPFAVLEHD